ncbi:hypothetical protein NF27_CS00040 [Candidatus Jidaibacter acanthamoeba]|uniref:Uncharacterized protein n=1 Tax=Candidatus Jidaibacter acanthamoebae TaxID=86105 RepID=A0A0C1MUL6_9RICK|nr:hypothetical protein [Candidatus Jidaibacter acanthamoeba]KIE05792.1 hypothetical protein NF27_CS00040 [Candidatus Jidaibacter acanthamoeba]
MPNNITSNPEQKDQQKSKLSKKKKFIILIIVILSVIILNRLFDRRPFRFEDFSSQEEAQNYFDKHYPFGSRGNTLIIDLQEAGAQCAIISKSDNINFNTKQPFDRMVSCDYFTGWFSKDPLVNNVVAVFIDENSQIKEIHAVRHYGWK